MAHLLKIKIFQRNSISLILTEKLTTILGLNHFKKDLIQHPQVNKNLKKKQFLNKFFVIKSIFSAIFQYSVLAAFKAPLILY